MSENLNERIAALEKATEEINRTLWRLVEAVYGNGKPGLITELQLLRRAVDAHHTEATTQKADWKWLISLLIAAAAVAVAAIK